MQAKLGKATSDKLKQFRDDVNEMLPAARVASAQAVHAGSVQAIQKICATPKNRRLMALTPSGAAAVGFTPVTYTGFALY